MEGEPLKKLHAHLCASLATTPSSLRWDIKRDARRLSPPPLHAEKPPPLPRQSFHQREKEGERESAAHPPSLPPCFRPRLSTSFASESVSVVWWLAREERQRRLVCVYVFLLAPSAFGAPTIMGGREEGGRKGQSARRSEGSTTFLGDGKSDSTKGRKIREGRRRADCCFRKNPAGIRVPRGNKYSGMRCTFASPNRVKLHWTGVVG